MLEEIRSYKGKTLFLALLCIVANFSYYPMFVSNGIGRRINTVLWILLGFVVIYDNRIAIGGRLLKLYCGLLFILILNTGIVAVATGENAFDNHFFQPVMNAFLIFFCANTLGYEIDKEKLKKICYVYMYSMLIISVLLFIFYLRGTDLNTKIYGYRYGKNEIAVLLLCGLIIACTVYEANTSIKNTIRIFAMIFFVIDILYLRCRSVMVGVVILVVSLVLNSKNIKTGFRLLITLIILAGVVFAVANPNKFDSFMNQFVYACLNSNDMNDLTSGRGDQISAGFSVFTQNLLVGVGHYHKTLDCFYVSVLVNYGLMGWPLLLMAVIPLIWSILNLKKSEPIDFCFFVISASIFVVSVLEELAPFGPGTRCYLLWLMWGILARRKRIEQLRSEG